VSDALWYVVAGSDDERQGHHRDLPVACNLLAESVASSLVVALEVLADPAPVISCPQR
jgi:hypothetical protein